MRRYYAVTQRAEWVFDGELAVGRRPVSAAHAKEMGTDRTVCGLSCVTWERLWEERFPVAGCECCATCLSITTSLRSPRT